MRICNNKNYDIVISFKKKKNTDISSVTEE